MRGDLVAILLVALLPSCARENAGNDASAITAYVGSSTCTTCHQEVGRTWERSNHHLAMVAVTPDAPGVASATDDGPLVRDAGGLAITAQSLGHTTSVRVAYALGHKHVGQYLGVLEPGRFQALPRAFDVLRQEWFDLFAGETRTPMDWGHWTNRGMTANLQCLACHTTGYDKGYEPGRDTYDTRWVEMGVGCEACHGPGEPHVTARRLGRPDPWRTRDPDRLLAACGACHSRRIERGAFTPGDDAYLHAFEPEVLDTEAYHPDGQVKDELYELGSFLQSKMFHEGVRCWNCHDPHGDGTRAVGSALCRSCHDASYEVPSHTHHLVGSAGADCRGCHMPTTVYMQRDPRHDHAFGRPDPDLTLSLGVPNACNRCHADRSAAWARDHVRSWYPNDRVRTTRRRTAEAIAAARRGDAHTVPVLLELLGTARDAVHRASAARLLARFPTSSGVSTGLRQALGDDDALVRASASWALGQRPRLDPDLHTALIPLLEDSTRIVRQHAAFALRLASSLPSGAQTARTRATNEWIAGQRWLGDTPEAHYNLGILHSARGEVEAARTAYEHALRLWPRSFQARHNLGMLLAQSGALDAAAREFEMIVAQDPVPDSAFALGLLRAEQGRWPEAIAALERCVSEDPSYPRARYNLALAKAKVGDTVAALDELERAAALEETRREAILALIDLARQVGDKPRVERWILEAAKLEPATVAGE